MSTPPGTPASLGIALANSGRKWIGEVAHVALLYRELLALGHRPWIICRHGSALHHHAREHGWSHLPLSFAGRRHPFRFWADLRAWHALIHRENINLIHGHRGADHWLGAFAARWPWGRLACPLVRTRHVMTRVPHNFANRWLYLKASAAVLSVSAAVQAGFGDWVSSLPRGRVILSAIQTDRFAPAHRSEAWRRTHAAPNFQSPDAPEPLWFGLVGRFQRIKGQAVFMEAAARVAAELPHAHFVMAGAGGRHLINKWQGRFAGPRGFGERVLVLDMVENLPALLASLDIGVIASVGSEGSSRIALEMMASALPLVATRVGGIPEIVTPTQAARLVPPRDPEALAQAMLAAARDSAATRSETGARAREYVLAHHTPHLWIRQIEAVYRDVLANPLPLSS